MVIEAFTITDAAEQSVKAWSEGKKVRIEQDSHMIWVSAEQAKELATVLPKLAAQAAAE